MAITSHYCSHHVEVDLSRKIGRGPILKATTDAARPKRFVTLPEPGGREGKARGVEVLACRAENVYLVHAIPIKTAKKVPAFFEYAFE